MPPKAYRQLRFGDWALKLGFMTQEDLKYILSKKNISKQMIGQLCLEEGLIDEEEVRALTATVQDLAAENLRRLKDLSDAVQRVARLHARAVEEQNSEGLYGSSGRNLRAAELSPAGMKLEL